MLRRLFVLLTLAITMSCAVAAEQPNLVGDWAGTLTMGGGSLRLIFHITDGTDGYTVFIESVDQGNAMIPTEIVVDGASVSFAVQQLDVKYAATVSGNQMVGEFTQMGLSMPDLTLVRSQ